MTESESNMNTFYVTFGQSHSHEYNGILVNKDIVARMIIDGGELEAGRIAFSLFKNQWCWLYDNEPDMRFYPRGFIDIAPQ